MSEELCYVGWWNSLVAESFQHSFSSTVQMFSQYWIFDFSILRRFLYQPAKIVYTDLALPFKQDLRRLLLRPLYGLLPNKMGFLHLSYSQIFFPDHSFYSFNWVFLTTVRGNQFRCRRPYMGYISASLCFRVPFLVLYKLYIISCFN